MAAMQRFASLFIIVSIVGVSVPFGSLSVAQAATVMSESFGTGNSSNDISGWEESGNDNDSHTQAESAENSGEDSYSPADGNDTGRFAKIGDGEWMCRSVNAAGFSSMVLKYYWRGDGDAESSDLGVVEYRSSGNCDDSSGWNTLAQHALDDSSNPSSTSQEPWSAQQSVNLPASLNNDSFWLLRFRNSAGQSDEYFRIDAVSIETSGDTTAPTVTNVTSSTANGAYNAGDTISIQVQFSESVIVTGAPRITLETGATDRLASYGSGSNTSTLTFSYTVQSGDTSADLDYASAAALALNGGTIKDAAGNDAVLTLATPGSANSLGANKSIIVDTTAPVLAEVTPVPALANDSTPSYTFSASEAGSLTYAGGCTSGSASAIVGNNTITFASLADGTYGSCTMKATDAAGNDSNTLAVSSFDIDTTPPVIVIAGDNPMDLGTGDTFSDPGASANDAHDGVVSVNSSGSVNTAVPGTYTITYSATDAAGNAASAPRAVNVSDDDAPIFVGVPSDMTVEAVDAAGATVSYVLPSASDNVDGDVSASVSCTPASGSVFAIGTTVVGCSVSDAAGNAASDSFSIIVEDTTAPMIVTTGDQTIEATGPDGAAAIFTTTATDAVSGDVTATIVCDALSGNTFPLGSTLVTCTADDAAGNTGSASFTITVEDTTAPTITIDPASLFIQTIEESGAQAWFGTNASDIVDADLSISCSPNAGSVIPPGVTIVTCTATDDAGNVGSDTMAVTVEHFEGTGGSTDVSAYEPQAQAPIPEIADVPVVPETAEVPSVEEPTPEGEVLGASCVVLDGFVGMGSDDADDVKLVQEYLNKELGLTLEVNGVYDTATRDAVKSLQVKYAAEILAPWIPFGHDGKTPTGVVYKTTQYWINKTNCAGIDIPMPTLP